MEKMWKTMPLFFIFGIVIALFTAFVLQNLWNWFAVPTLHVPTVSFWAMYGFALLIGLFQGDSRSNDQIDNKRWEAVFYALDFCLTAEQREELQDFIKCQLEGVVWANGVSLVLGKITGNALTLAVGWGVHEFLM